MDTAGNDAARMESDLVERMLAGENGAWREFVARYGGLIVRVMRGITHRFPHLANQTEVDDLYAGLLMDLLCRDMHKLRMFDFERGHRLSTWVGLLAAHKAWDHVRSAGRRREWPQGTFDDAMFVAVTLDPLSSLLAREDCSAFFACCSELSARDQQFVDLFYLNGASPEHIASVMGISVKTVYSKKHKVKARLETVRQRELA